MKISKSLLAAAALVASFGNSSTAGAQVVGSRGPTFGMFIGLSAPALCTVGTPCTLDGGLGSIVGGSIYMADQPFADIPAGGVFGSRFLAAGPTSTGPSTLTFSGAGIAQIGFLWGSPDLFNQLTVNSMMGGVPMSQVFTAAMLGFPSITGNQSVSESVRFVAGAGRMITSLQFASPQSNAFEVANFNTVVPEPATYVLMATGLLALGLVSRRRKQA